MDFLESYKSCTLCPRNCKTDRTENKIGFCKETASLKAAVACLHFGEEPPITVNGGSGTLFVTGCNLRCAFCQNYQISQCGLGKELSIEETVKLLFKVKVEQKVEREQVAKVTGTNKDDSLAKAPVKRAESKVYPNDPCPCGSGKKYKQCCGRK